ncbi:MAG: hypothetical protein Hyperionvirus2_60 [Hyperionvirus sp.]|uniref:Transmembrane protein n=1 Tax=Hyperionvirus sp. TaxID=2487770 RepID=A0A3G5A6N2_9VIRU|nr:MAG: hypothetical protein Hyperionvirus2_60 [Hyperionvirus sp.]
MSDRVQQAPGEVFRRSDEPEQSLRYKKFFSLMRGVFTVIFFIIFTVSLMGWLVCFDVPACQDAAFPIGPVKDGGYTTCCTNSVPVICLANVVTYRECDAHDKWIWTFYGNVIGYVCVMLILYLMKRCLLLPIPTFVKRDLAAQGKN